MSPVCVERARNNGRIKINKFVFLPKTFLKYSTLRIRYRIELNMSLLIFSIYFLLVHTEKAEFRDGWRPNPPAIVFGKYKYRKRNIQEDIIRYDS